MRKSGRVSVKSIARWRAAAASRSRAKRGCAATVLMSCLVFAGCGGSTLTPRDAAYEPMPQEPMPVDAGGDGVDGPPIVDGAQCTAVIEQHPDEGANHIACTSVTNYGSMPPSSGNHFGCWPEYRTF